MHVKHGKTTIVYPYEAFHGKKILKTQELDQKFYSRNVVILVQT